MVKIRPGLFEAVFDFFQLCNLRNNDYMQNIYLLDSLQSLPRKALATIALTVGIIGSAQDAVSANPTTPWTTCAAEGGECSFSGSKVIRYGSTGHYVYKALNSPVQCVNNEFGDPTSGISKECAYQNDPAPATAGLLSMPKVAPVPVTAPVLVPPVDVPPIIHVSVAKARDALKWPFASHSIWNMPIGSGAVYVPANLASVPGNDSWAPMPQVDEEHIILRPTAPLTNVYYSNAGWTGRDRCAATGKVLATVPIPSNYVVPNDNTNGSSVVLQADGRTLIHVQPLARCASGTAATAYAAFENVDLFGDGIAGSHGGSGMSAIGGSLRVGELRPGEQGPRHALKVNVYAKQALYRCGSRKDCYRWPASTSDGYAVGHYGAVGNNGNSAMKMGALLAIPASRDIDAMGLETEPARQLAWTLQNYGAYIVDDTYGPSFGLNVENGTDGSLPRQFKSDWGFPFEQRVKDNTSWTRDMQRLVKALSVVDNNRADNIGGGGTPRQTIAPVFQ